MLEQLTPILLQWLITALSLWICSHVFAGVKFESTGALVISALLLGFANAVVRPLLVFLTFPLTLLTLGFFLLVINALMLLLVAKLVKGFTISGFWTAFFAAIFIWLLSFIFGTLLSPQPTPPLYVPSSGGTWL